jgi:hypothetical protein
MREACLRHRRGANSTVSDRHTRRPGPVGPMPDAVLLEAIRRLPAASPFHGQRYRQI